MEIPFFHSNFSSLGAVLGVGLGLLLGSGCVAQQADLAKLQKDLEMQISKIKEEKRALGAQVDEAVDDAHRRAGALASAEVHRGGA